MKTVWMNPSLREILLPSLAPCASFNDICSAKMRWLPAAGHVPRSWLGATGEIAQVQLVLITAEPGDPAENERFDDVSADAIMLKYEALSMDWLQNSSIRRAGTKPGFHDNLRHIILLCWPGLSFEEQMRRTWITPTVLCSAEKSGGNVPVVIANRCGADYLKPQLALLRSAFIIALGGKALQRLKRIGIEPQAVAQHPSARPVTKPEATWEAAALQFRQSRQINEHP